MIQVPQTVIVIVHGRFQATDIISHGATGKSLVLRDESNKNFFFNFWSGAFPVVDNVICVISGETTVSQVMNGVTVPCYC